MKQKMMKKVLSVMTVTAMLAGMSTVSVGAATDDNSGKTIGISMCAIESQMWTEYQSSMHATCDEAGIKYTESIAENDVQKQNQQIEDFISQGVDAIIIAPADGDAVVSAIKKCNDAGIPVIMANRAAGEGAEVYATISSDNKERCDSMQYADRTGRSLGGSTLQDRFLENLYASFLGRMLIKPLVHPAFSKICGVFLDSPLSAPIIPGFMKSAGICAEDCETPAGGRYRSFNAFFTRRMLPEARPFDARDHILCSPCDGFASVYPIHNNMRITIKHTQYTLEQLIRDSGLAARYAGGTALLLRLTVSDYHRYAYVDRGRRSSYRRIPGVLHTVIRQPPAAVLSTKKTPGSIPCCAPVPSAQC